MNVDGMCVCVLAGAKVRASSFVVAVGVKRSRCEKEITCFSLPRTDLSSSAVCSFSCTFLFVVLIILGTFVFSFFFSTLVFSLVYYCVIRFYKSCVFVFAFYTTYLLTVRLFFFVYLILCKRFTTRTLCLKKKVKTVIFFFCPQVFLFALAGTCDPFKQDAS